MLFALTMSEIGLRVAGVSYERTSAPDPIRGRALIAGQQRWYGDEGGGHVRINSAGFRDEEWAIAKPANTVRIALLGDSFVEAPQVAENERFGELLQRQLTADRVLGDRAVQVLNFGVSGYGTAEELLTFRHVV